jgi:hypothetical protein
MEFRENVSALLLFKVNQNRIYKPPMGTSTGRKTIITSFLNDMGAKYKSKNKHCIIYRQHTAYKLWYKLIPATSNKASLFESCGITPGNLGNTLVNCFQEKQYIQIHF